MKTNRRALVQVHSGSMPPRNGSLDGLGRAHDMGEDEIRQLTSPGAESVRVLAEHGAKAVYPRALAGLIGLLNGAGSQFWAAWLEEDVANWEREASVEHHLAAYGAMGSINDVWLLATEGQFDPMSEPWVNEAFVQLKSIAFAAASRLGQGRQLTALELIATGGAQPQTTGWRCMTCGSIFVMADTAPRLAASIWARTVIPGRLATDDVASVVSGAVDPGDDVECRSVLALASAAVDRLGLPTIDRPWPHGDPCPVCEAADWAIYNFRALTEPLRVVPGENLEWPRAT
jgi:hypothetical protein